MLNISLTAFNLRNIWKNVWKKPAATTRCNLFRNIPSAGNNRMKSNPQGKLLEWVEEGTNGCRKVHGWSFGKTRRLLTRSLVIRTLRSSHTKRAQREREKEQARGKVSCSKTDTSRVSRKKSSSNRVRNTVVHHPMYVLRRSIATYTHTVCVCKYVWAQRARFFLMSCEVHVVAF